MSYKRKIDSSPRYVFGSSHVKIILELRRVIIIIVTDVTAVIGYENIFSNVREQHTLDERPSSGNT